MKTLITLAIPLALVVVVLGAFTRLSDAGLGCPDWPGCYGHLTWPVTGDEVAAAEAKFPEAPVEHDKTWPEMVHRYFAGALGLFILAMAIVAIKNRQAGAPVKLSVALLLLVIIQAAFGMWTVTLKLWPQVVTAHLLGGFATLSLLWLLAQRLYGCHWQPGLQQNATLGAIGPWAMAALAVVVVQIALGGWVSSNYAALACVDLPTCHGQWWPDMDFAQGFNIFQHVGPNYLGGLLDGDARTAIHVTHRLGALVVSALLLGLAWRLFASGFPPARRWALALILVLLLQITLGISNIVWVLPLPVAVAHNAVGACLLLVVVAINHRLRTVKPI